MLIAVEGLDGAGKSTLCRALAGITIDRVRIRSTGEMQSRFGSVLREHLGQLDAIEKVYWFAADRASVVATVRDELTDGHTVVLWDRYVDSARAYRSAEARIGEAPAWIMSVVERVNAWFPVPDATIYLDVGLQDARRRVPLPGAATDPRLPYVLEFYRTRIEDPTARYMVVDARQPIEIVHDQVVERLEGVLK